MKVTHKKLDKIFNKHSRYCNPEYNLDNEKLKINFIRLGSFKDNPFEEFMTKCGYTLVEETFTLCSYSLLRITHQIWEKRTVLSKWDHRYMDMAELIASWSKDPSTKCGAVLVNKGHRVSLGFNGYPHGIADTGLENRKEKYEKIIHAEVNAILHARCNLKNMTLYVYPLPPCARCMALIVQSGIKRIVTMKAKGELLERWNETNKIAFAMANEANIKIEYMED